MSAMYSKLFAPYAFDSIFICSQKHSFQHTGVRFFELLASRSIICIKVVGIVSSPFLVQ